MAAGADQAGTPDAAVEPSERLRQCCKVLHRLKKKGPRGRHTRVLQNTGDTATPETGHDDQIEAPALERAEAKAFDDLNRRAGDGVGEPAGLGACLFGGSHDTAAG